MIGTIVVRAFVLLGLAVLILVILIFTEHGRPDERDPGILRLLYRLLPVRGARSPACPVIGILFLGPMSDRETIAPFHRVILPPAAVVPYSKNQKKNG